MSYRIHITEAAKDDLMSVVEYIDGVLKNPQAADNLIEAVDREINGLGFFPQRHGFPDDSVLRSMNIRFVKVKNYLVFYVISEEEKQIVVLRFLHMRQDWMGVLRLSGS